MSFRIAQVSDAHLSPSRPFFEANFSRAAQSVREAKPDLMIASGDLSLNGADSDEDLRHAVARHAELGIDWLAVPGNHDIGDVPTLPGKQLVTPERQARWLAATGRQCWHRDIPGWRLIGLDTQSLPVDEAQWDACAEAVHGAGTRRIALFMHKPLCEETLADTALNYWAVPPAPRARLLQHFGENLPGLVASGHVHQWRQVEERGMRQVWAPGTSFIVGDAWHEPRGAKLVGWVEHVLHADGSHESMLRTVDGMSLNDLGTTPEVYGPLARVSHGGAGGN
ncbi:MAG: metallophosphoesterase [Rubritepida sp.]|nr:metallophosphoesterase [Rubritepida sp.]